MKTSFSEFLNEQDSSFNYRMLSRLQQDCEYFLNHGGRSENVLYYKNIKEHIAEMKKLWNSFPDNAKPEWLSYEDIENYEKEMLKEQ